MCNGNNTDKPVPEEDVQKGFGITEAPKDHPDNENGNLKVIME